MAVVRRVAVEGTPVYIYDERIIQERIRELKCFDVIRYAQKACNNLAILALMRREGVVVDAVSAGEIVRAIRGGYQPTPHDGHADIVYTADMFDKDALELVAEYGMAVNVGSGDMLSQLAAVSKRSPVTVRINPGFGHGHSAKTNTGGPCSKHGVWHEELATVLTEASTLGLTVTGLHMHIGSGSDFEHLSQVCGAMVQAARVAAPICGASLRSISAGGGLPIPYRGEARMDVPRYYQLWDGARKSIQEILGHPVALEVEPGRYLMAESGSLVSEVRALKHMGENPFVILDAGFNNLVRPSMYGAYHRISIVPRDGRELGAATKDVVVAGPLCESGDVFTQGEGGIVQTRALPADVHVGDYAVIHDVGAYGSSMASNYNTKALAREVLVRSGALDAAGEPRVDVIREKQTYDAMFQFEKIPDDIGRA